jgi:hypothetical protein
VSTDTDYKCKLKLKTEYKTIVAALVAATNVPLDHSSADSESESQRISSSFLTNDTKSDVAARTTRKTIYCNILDSLLVSAGNSSRYQYWWAYQPIQIIYY